VYRTATRYSHDARVAEVARHTEGAVMGRARGTQWTSQELWAALEEFERELEAAGLRANSIETYVGRTTIFLRWLDGDYTPRGPA
jgi:hypothetical protein